MHYHYAIITNIAPNLVILPILFSVAYITLLERTLLAQIQIRIAPSNLAIFGLLQPWADALKLVAKETFIPGKASSLFSVAPLLAWFFSLLAFSTIPTAQGVVWINYELGLLVLLALDSLGLITLLAAGWGSASHFSLLGSIRAVAQIISYEISIGLITLTLLTGTGTLNFLNIVTFQVGWVSNIPNWTILHSPHLALLFWIALLAECNRTPFDLTEAESELVSGFNTEYASLPFAYFFLSEYSHILLLTTLFSTFWLGGFTGSVPLTAGWHYSEPITGSTKIIIVIGVIIWMRGCFPRTSYSKLMGLGWKVILPATCSYLITSMCCEYLFID